MRPGRPALVLLLFLGLLSVACGKKGDPFVPAKEAANRVDGLDVGWKGAEVLLTGRIEKPAEMREGEGFRVYYAVYPLDQPPCEGCPIEFQGYYTFGREAVSGDAFSCKVPEIRRGSVYFFEARVMTPEGTPGPPSNRVSIEVPEKKTLE
jgi:hypothetical protein